MMGKYNLLILPLIVIAFALIVYFSFALYFQKRLSVEYQSSYEKINEYQKWGLKTDDFVKLLFAVHPFTQNHSLHILPLVYSQKKGALDNIVNLANQHYATESIRQTEELLSRIAYVRDRAVKNKELNESDVVNALKQIQTVSGTVFENRPTLSTIIQAKRSIDDIDNGISVSIEKIRTDSLFSELEKYRNRCQEDEIFFIQRKSVEGQNLTKKCLLEIDTVRNQQDESSGSAVLATLVGEHIYSLVADSEKLRNQIFQNELFAELEKRKQHERLTLVPPPAVTAGKVIVINLGIQRLYAYQDGKSVFPTAVPITSGKNGFETVTGEFAIYYKQRNFRMTSPFPGIYYDNVVDYWMPFYLGYGIHDASWRTVYGTQDYPSVGSHGCVNTPLAEVAFLYNWAEVGTKVIVY